MNKDTESHLGNELPSLLGAKAIVPEEKDPSGPETSEPYYLVSESDQFAIRTYALTAAVTFLQGTPRAYRVDEITDMASHFESYLSGEI